MDKLPRKRGWPVPELNRAGQQVFWDCQAPAYEEADMTQGNAGELELVAALCDDFISCGYVAEDVVTLGGANGCRDPLIVTDTLQRHGQQPQKVFFNDLSVAMTRAALEGSLASYHEKAVLVDVIPGPIHEIVERITTAPRRVILGIYSARSLVDADPQRGHPLAGLEEYVRNSRILGNQFTIECLGFRAGEYVDLGLRMFLSAEHAEEELPTVLDALRLYLSGGAVDIVRVIGQHAGDSGFFLSHWFTEAAAIKLAQACFHSERVENMLLLRCAKGFVIRIDPISKPRGIVTVLNNVLGNVLPHEQCDTLRAVDRLST